MSINTDKGKHLNLFTSSPKTKNKVSNKAFDMMTVAADKTAIDFSKQDIQLGLDEKKIKQWHESSLSTVEKSTKRQTQRDKLAEESFENVFSAVLNPGEDARRINFPEGRKTVQEHHLFKDVSGYIKGDENYETKLGIYKERLHDVWDAMGKPLIKMERNPLNARGQRMGKQDAPGQWFFGGKRDYMIPWKITEPPPAEPFSIESFFTQQDTSSLYDIYEKRHGKLTGQGISYQTSPKGRQDWMNINPKSFGSGFTRTLLAELGHQMQGRHITGAKEAQHFMNVVSRQHRYEDKYADPRTIEYHAHETMEDILYEYMKTGDKEILKKIKLGDYPNIKDTFDW
tara:strand:+ start:1505 stop:2530 length:1026 start_codon:yes stop_codon:yes gene_type:complete